MKKVFKKYRKLVLTICSLVAFAFIFIAPISTSAQTATEKSRCDKFATYFNFGGGQNVVNGLPKICSLSQLMTFVLEKLLAFAGVVSVLFLVLGGFFYITAAGNDEQIEKGKKILVNSLIGLVVVLMATAIVRIVSGTLNGNNSSTTTTTNTGGK